MNISIEQYIEIIKHHEKYRLSTDARNKFWKELEKEINKNKG